MAVALQILDGGLSPAEIAREVEQTRVQAIIDIDRKIASLKRKRADLANSVRSSMKRDGVVRAKYSNGVAYLKPSVYWDTPSARRRERVRFGCNLQGRRDPYLVVIPTEPNDAA